MNIESSISLDLHGKNVYQAKTAVDAALRRAGGVYRICLIHGYRQGDAIKSMIRERYASHPLVLEVRDGNNQGQTDLILREI